MKATKFPDREAVALTFGVAASALVVLSILWAGAHTWSYLQGLFHFIR